MARTRALALVLLLALVGGQVLPSAKCATSRRLLVEQDDGGDGGDVGVVGEDDGSLDVPVAQDDGGDGGDGGEDLGDEFTPVIDSADIYVDDEGIRSNATMVGGLLGSGPPCGWGQESCTKYMGDRITVALWMCSDPDPNNCDCGPGGCGRADAGFIEYELMLDGSDNTCDTLGGWREGDLHFEAGKYSTTVGSIHWEVHPDDLAAWKAPPDGVNQGNVRVMLFPGDYCTGTRAGGADGTYWAWDTDKSVPGQWVLEGGPYEIKSVRPYVDQGDQTWPSEAGVGIKFVGWPGGHMGYPFDEIRCDGDEYITNVDDGVSIQGCASAVDQIWCVEPGNDDGKNSYFGNGIDTTDGSIDFGGNKEFPKGWQLGVGGVPMGSMKLGFYEGRDKWKCDYNWYDFCTDGGLNPGDWCLHARFLNGLDHIQDKDQAFKEMIGETYINMQYLCDISYGGEGFCVNTYANPSEDPSERDICSNGMVTDQSGFAIDEWPIFVNQVWTTIEYNWNGADTICS